MAKTRKVGGLEYWRWDCQERLQSPYVGHVLEANSNGPESPNRGVALLARSQVLEGSA
jgi:hypothetical protein